MKHLKGVLLLIRGSRDFEAPLKTAVWICKSSGAQLHVLIEEPFSNRISSLKRQFHQSRDLQKGAIIESVSKITLTKLKQLSLKWGGHELWVLGAQGGGHREEVLDERTVAIIEGLRDPVLLLPQDVELKLPWNSMIAPMSGEARCNRALSHALELANLLHIPLDIVHVVDPFHSARHGNLTVGRFGDQAHHELAPMVEEFISEACPFFSTSQKRVIRRFLLIQGEVTRELIRVVSDSLVGALVVEWKGCFMKGHADILKALMMGFRKPLILVRQSQSSEEGLRAGHRLVAS